MLNKLTVKDIFDIATVQPKKQIFKDEGDLNNYGEIIKIEKKKKKIQQKKDQKEIQEILNKKGSVQNID